MIPTSSKFFYGLATVLFATAAVYGYVTGGGEVGPLSLGYKGAVGDLLGYTVLIVAAIASLFLGLAQTAFRDADPDVAAEMVGGELRSEPTPGTSYWPILGAFGAGLTVVGVVLDNVFFVAGLIVIGAAALEWTMQAWSDRATGDPAVNREIRNRIMYPIEVPVAGALAIAIVIGGFSRLFLTVSKEGAVWVAIAFAALVFVVGTVLSTRDRIRTDLVAALLAVGAVATIGLGIFGAVNGERDFEEHHSEDEEHSEEGSEAEGSDAEADEAEGAVTLEESN